MVLFDTIYIIIIIPYGIIVNRVILCFFRGYMT